MSQKRLFIVGEKLEWNWGSYEDAKIRDVIRRGEAPEHPVVVEAETVDNQQYCPMCGSTDLTVGHDSWRIDASPDGREWSGILPHPQRIKLLAGPHWWSGDWFT